MKNIITFLNNSFDKQIDGTGLAIFRMAYSVVLLCEIMQMYYFKELIFDKIPFIDSAEINFGIPIGIWFISVVFILFGAFTKTAAFVNYLLSLILIGSINSFEYHVFYAYMGINFFMIFMPVSQCLSIDRLIQKLKYSNTTFQYNPSKNISQLYYFILPFFGIGLVYFDSVFFKLASPMWLSGLGSWYPSSLPMIAHVNTSWLLNQEYLVKIIGWSTMLFEAAFLFLFFRRKFRIPFFAIGMILHFGILVQFPIPWFGLTVCVLYLLLVPVSFWKGIFEIKEPRPTLFFFYDSECPLCIRTKIIISHFDWFSKIGFRTVQFDASKNSGLNEIPLKALLDDIHSVDPDGRIYSGIDTYIQVFKRIFYLYPIALLLQSPGAYDLAKRCYKHIAENRNTERCTEENCGYNPPSIPNDKKLKILNNYTLFDLKKCLATSGLLFLALVQFTFLYKTWFAQDMKQALGFKNTLMDKAITKTINYYSPEFRIYLGLTNHPVFSDSIHFEKYNHIVSISYLDHKSKGEVRLPIVSKKGHPDWYLYGNNWVNWTFRVNNPTIDTELLSKGIQRYTAFWAIKNHIDLMDATFLIKVKKIDSPSGWEKDFLNKQIAKPWTDGGTAEWKNKKFRANIKNIEQL